MLNRLTNILEDYKQLIEDKLKKYDKEETGNIHVTKFLQVLQEC